MVCFEVLLFSGRVVLVKTGFVIDKSERSSVPCRIHYPLVVPLKNNTALLAKIITIDTPTNINTDNAADAT